MAYRLHKKFWGKGYATELAKALIEHGLNNLKLPRIIAPVHPDNKASIRVLEKAGMDYCGTIDFRHHILPCYEILNETGNIIINITGKKVCKPKQSWSKQLHDFLSFIRSKGANFVPEPIGFDSKDNEVLSYIDGETCDYPLTNDIKSEEALISSAKLLRKYHHLSEHYIRDTKPVLTGCKKSCRSNMS